MVVPSPAELDSAATLHELQSRMITQLPAPARRMAWIPDPFGGGASSEGWQRRSRFYLALHDSPSASTIIYGSSSGTSWLWWRTTITEVVRGEWRSSMNRSPNVSLCRPTPTTRRSEGIAGMALILHRCEVGLKVMSDGDLSSAMSRKEPGVPSACDAGGGELLSLLCETDVHTTAIQHCSYRASDDASQANRRC
jgi:hypothetical protein